MWLDDTDFKGDFSQEYVAVYKGGEHSRVDRTRGRPERRSYTQVDGYTSRVGPGKS